MMASEDQADRRAWAEAGDNDVKVRELVAANDHKRATRVRQLLELIRNPAAANIGLDGSRALWLVTQHSDLDLMLLVLKLFRHTYYRRRQNIFYQGIPYLSDRTRIIQGYKQRYGTQYFVGDDNQSHRFPVTNPQLLKQRRLSFGLCVRGECGRG